MGSKIGILMDLGGLKEPSREVMSSLSLSLSLSLSYKKLISKIAIEIGSWEVNKDCKL